MTAVVRFDCPFCHTSDVRRNADNVTLDSDGILVYVEAICPECYATVRQPVTRDKAGTLLENGAHRIP